MRLIDADELREFFFSEASGTEETINDLMMKHNLDYSHDVNEDDVMDFAKDLLLAVRNVIDTELTVEYDKQVRAKVMEELFNTPMEEFGGVSLKEVYEEACKMPYDEGWNVCYENFLLVAEQLKEQKNE